MNQILSVDMSDYERNTKKPNKRNGKNDKKANTKSVLIFFCIVLLILGIIMVAIGLYSYLNKEEENSDNTAENSTTEDSTTDKPVIEIVEGTSTLTITVKSDYAIDNVIYSWNGGEETQVNGNGESEVELENISIPEGTNTLTITAKDINGTEETTTKEYTGNASTTEYTPTITLQQESNTINIVISSETTLDYVSYTFDDETDIKEGINDTTVEIPIEVTSGDHVLSITIANVDGETYEDSKSFSIPTVSVAVDGEDFVISANASINITTIEITLNGEEQSAITVNDTEYEGTLPLEEGENKLIIVVNTENGSYTRKIKYEN